MRRSTKPNLTESITVKVTPDLKKKLTQKAFDDDDSICRIIRRAITNTYPELADAKT